MRVAILLVFALPAFSQAPVPLPQGASLDIVIQRIWGDVDYQADPKAKWLSAERGCKLGPGGSICTGDNSQVLLSMGTNCLVFIDEMSMLTIKSFNIEQGQVVARALLDPGVAMALVRQVPSFRTEVTITEPRLTCSVHSCVWVDRNGDEDWQRDEVLDFGRLQASDRNLLEQLLRQAEEALAREKMEKGRQLADRERVCSYGSGEWSPFDIARLHVEQEATRFIFDVIEGKAGDQANDIRDHMTRLRERLLHRSSPSHWNPWR